MRRQLGQGPRVQRDACAASTAGGAVAGARRWASRGQRGWRVVAARTAAAAGESTLRVRNVAQVFVREVDAAAVGIHFICTHICCCCCCRSWARRLMLDKVR